MQLELKKGVESSHFEQLHQQASGTHAFVNMISTLLNGIFNAVFA